MKLLKAKEAVKQYNMGLSSMKKYAEESGAVVRIGRIWRLDAEKFEEW